MMIPRRVAGPHAIGCTLQHDRTGSQKHFQLLGGCGFVNDFPVERMMRAARITQI
jgi:alkylation response protein AidB-like acyl-CoA dehydrogenase